MDSMQKSAKESIMRQRMEFDAETKAEEAAKKKFDSLVSGLKEKWDGQETERTKQCEERVRIGYQNEILELKTELEEMNKISQVAHGKWATLIKEQNDKHVKGLKVFGGRAKLVYEERLVDITKRMEDGFNRYTSEASGIGIGRGGGGGVKVIPHLKKYSSK